MNRFFLTLLFLPCAVFAQNYTSYFTGNPADTITIPRGGVCLMGGASEDDNAMKWFLQGANGGNVLVLRTSGSNGYNSYMFSLGVPIRSVESIVFNNPSASNEPYILQKIQQAEAIWFAGGDQWDYIRYWRNTPVDSLINLAIEQRNAVTGGTSAGMAILGKYYFTAQNGTVTSAEALANPYNIRVKVDSAAFLHCNYLDNLITDTHFDNPDRKGRLVVFLARIFKDYGIFAKGIACDEYTAVCVDTTGLARVYGSYPSYEDNAFFVQNNCELSSQAPENCTPGNPITWNLGGEAIKVYRVKGTSSGNNTFDLNDWKTGSGGTWLNWSANNGSFTEQAGNAIDCGSVSVHGMPAREDFRLFPNPATERIVLDSDHLNPGKCTFEVLNATGQQMPARISALSDGKVEIELNRLDKGIYFLRISENGNRPLFRTLIKSE